MADKTIGELKRAISLDDDSLMIAEQQGEAVSVTGGLFKSFAQESTKAFAESASADAAAAAGAKDAAQSALKGVQAALNNIPAGGTLVINDLTTGGKSAALSAEMGKILGHRPNRNLLRNWYFKNPVNQRGQTSYVKDTDAIDGWFTNSAACLLTVNSDHITMSKNPSSTSTATQMIQQLIENPARFSGATVTISALVKGTVRVGIYVDGSAVKNFTSYYNLSDYDVISWTVDLPDINESLGAIIQTSNGGTFEAIAAKLELGSVQTLAHKEGNACVLNEIPDYGVELAKCQRYFQVISRPIVSGFLTMDKTELRVGVPIPVTLRSTPTIADYSISGVRTTNGESSNPTVKSCSLYDVSNNSVSITFNIGTAYSDEKYLNNTPIGFVLEKLVLDAEM